MFHACWRWMRAHPAVVMLLTGVGLAVAPVSFAVFVERFVFARFVREQPTPVDEAFIAIYTWPYAGEIAISATLIGCIIALTGFLGALLRIGFTAGAKSSLSKT